MKGDYDESPLCLVENAGKAFTGSKIYGNGFTFDDSNSKGVASPLSEMNRVIAHQNKNSALIKPYLGGEEVTNHPSHAHRRFVIDFDDMPLRRDPGLLRWASLSEEQRNTYQMAGVVPTDYPYPTADDYPDLLDIVESNVKPERLKSRNAEVRQFPWWKYWRARSELYNTIEVVTYCLAVNAGASPQFTIARLPTGSVFSHALAIFAFATFGPFAVLQSRIHEIWARFFASSMKDDLRYTPSDCFETFPFPVGFETALVLETTGRVYHDRRAAVMVARDEGLTKTYNRFHDPAEQSTDIVTVRELHADMDRTVLRAYAASASAPEDAAAWNDLADRAEAVFLDETNEDDHTYQGRLFWPSAFRDEVLSRLLALNAERAAAERAAGLAPITNGAESGEVEDLDA